MAFLEATNIRKEYAGHLALNNVSISVEQGKIFGLLGPNGAGKTTLIRIINRITAPDEGTILFNNEAYRPEHLSEIGYLPEERGLYKKMKVGDQALYLARLKGMSRKDALKQLKYWFEKFEIQAWWDKKVEELSKGMQQKVQFITTVLHNPRFLIFDEPFSGFDPINANLLKQEILEFKKNGATIIFSTHNMESVEELCDDIALIHRANNILSGSVTEIKNRYKTNVYQAVFSGYVNMIEATLRHQYEIIKHTEENNLHVIHFKILDNTITTNQVISSLLPLGNMVSFNEILPSMNDIFINVVKEKNLE
ncbi:MAG: ABC transporter ATP-binding protein [Bacteroidetes bacterium HGW-Bacteroidetes-21]|jgi:ABC-2 type transport system ATP-binding protein|nr:MAG: ABC transporter ATP-binding protein [Bacteroidetes bacterium HGW-Bacteroidetes-21]